MSAEETMRLGSSITLGARAIVPASAEHLVGAESRKAAGIQGSEGGSEGPVSSASFLRARIFFATNQT